MNRSSGDQHGVANGTCCVDTLMDVRAIGVGHHHEVLGVVAADDAPEERELAT